MLSTAQRTIGFLIAAPIVAVGPFLLALALVSVVRTETFIHHSIAVGGKVVALRRVHGGGSRGGWLFAPVFEFTAQNGLTYMQVSRAPTAPPEFKVGDRVKVLYETGQPETARIDSFGEFFRFPTVAGFIGGVLSALTIALIRGRRRQRIIPSLWSDPMARNQSEQSTRSYPE
ncbi:MAG TPA: DUF3592 domain-containing protein [Acidobacteriaceae bacterium]|jgi:hypothetical protein|nr:DUF3592 domain-containing protein [Acidobacteriaceae bacterium]